jgi:hypothetical protein
VRIKFGKRIQPLGHVSVIVDIFEPANAQPLEKLIAILECARHECEDRKQRSESFKDLNTDFL